MPFRLTPRSSGAPTAGHQAQSGGTRYIFTSPGLASCPCRPLSSHVRPHQKLSVRQVHQSSVCGANSRKHRVRQGRVSAAMGGIEAPLHQPSKSNGLRFSVRAGLKPASPNTRGRRRGRRRGSSPQSLCGTTRENMYRFRAGRRGSLPRKAPCVASALAGALRGRQNPSHEIQRPQWRFTSAA